MVNRARYLKGIKNLSVNLLKHSTFGDIKWEATLNVLMSVLVCYCTMLLISQGQISSVMYLNAVAFEHRFAFAYSP